MVKKILLWLLACLAIVFVAVWIWTGGLGRAWTTAKSFTNIVDFFFYNGTSTKASFALPWQPEFPQVPSTLQSGGNGNLTPEQELASLTEEYNNLNAQAAESKTFGDPSPFKGQAQIISDGTARENSPQAEYIVVAAGIGNTAPVDMAGWSLQSAYTGVRAFVPQSSSLFLMGTVNNLSPLQLAPGQSAIINSGVSPVGVSFRQNICTGYLGQLQPFSPSLANSCPSPASELPINAGNLQKYGETCFDFLQTLPTCAAPLSEFPSNISSNCRAFAANALSYNGCVARHQSARDFLGESWRVFLNSRVELWRNSHDIIRLLDAGGRTVDVLTY